MIVRLLIVIACLVVGIAPTAAQTARAHRITLSVNAGAQTVANERSDRFEFPLFAETGTATGRQTIGPSRLLDGAAGVRLGGWLGVGVAASRVEGRETATIDALVPHPFFFEFPRAAMGMAAVEHREVAVHAQLQIWIPLGSVGRLTVGFGPTYFDATQEIVTSVATAEVGFPFDAVDIVDHTATRVTVTDIGYHVAVDAVYYGLRRLGILGRSGVLDHIGLGILARYSRATPTFELAGRPRPALELGGLHLAGGLRVGF